MDKVSGEDFTPTQVPSPGLIGSTLEEKLSEVTLACPEKLAACDEKENQPGLTRCGEMLSL